MASYNLVSYSVQYTKQKDSTAIFFKSHSKLIVEEVSDYFTKVFRDASIPAFPTRNVWRDKLNGDLWDRSLLIGGTGAIEDIIGQDLEDYGRFNCCKYVEKSCLNLARAMTLLWSGHPDHYIVKNVIHRSLQKTLILLARCYCDEVNLEAVTPGIAYPGAKQDKRKVEPTAEI